MAQQHRAVVDRIVDGAHAVLLVGDDETEVILPVTDLPEGAKEGSWLHVTQEADQVVVIGLDEQATGDAEERIASKLDELRQRGSRFQPE